MRRKRCLLIQFLWVQTHFGELYDFTTPVVRGVDVSFFTVFMGRNGPGARRRFYASSCKRRNAALSSGKLRRGLISETWFFRGVSGRLDCKGIVDPNATQNHYFVSWLRIGLTSSSSMKTLMSIVSVCVLGAFRSKGQWCTCWHFVLRAFRQRAFCT